MCLGILSKLDYKYIFLFFAVWSCLSSPDKRFTLSRGGRSSSRSAALLEIVSRLTRLLLLLRLLRLLRPGIFLDRRSSIRLLFSHWLGLHWPRLWSRLRKVFNIYMRNSKKLYFSIYQYTILLINYLRLELLLRLRSRLRSRLGLGYYGWAWVGRRSWGPRSCNSI